jgi:predicted dehydrogenase
MATKVIIGVIGAGGIARRRPIPGMLKAKNCRLAAVMDTAGIDALAAEYRVPGYATEAELLADPEVQASISRRLWWSTEL